jgi:hypothetical protein
MDKTVDAYNRLPDKFTLDDVKRCFNLECDTSARSAVHRLIADNYVEIDSKFLEKGKVRPLYRKTDKIC